MRAGLPATTVSGSTSLVTTAPAPTMARSPIVVRGSTGARADRRTPPDDDSFARPRLAASGEAVVGEGRLRPQEHPVLDDHSLPQIHARLDRHAIPHHDAVVDVGVIAYVALRAYAGLRHHVGERPDAGVGPDVIRLHDGLRVDVGCRHDGGSLKARLGSTLDVRRSDLDRLRELALQPSGGDR